MKVTRISCIFLCDFHNKPMGLELHHDSGGKGPERINALPKITWHLKHREEDLRGGEVTPHIHPKL